MTKKENPFGKQIERTVLALDNGKNFLSLEIRLFQVQEKHE
jgi:hypothetical protein